MWPASRLLRGCRRPSKLRWEKAPRLGTAHILTTGTSALVKPAISKIAVQLRRPVRRCSALIRRTIRDRRRPSLGSRSASAGRSTWDGPPSSGRARPGRRRRTSSARHRADRRVGGSPGIRRKPQGRLQSRDRALVIPLSVGEVSDAPLSPSRNADEFLPNPTRFRPKRPNLPLATLTLKGMIRRFRRAEPSRGRPARDVPELAMLVRRA